MRGRFTSFADNCGKKSDGLGLELYSLYIYGLRNRYIIKGFDGSLWTSCAENIVLEIRGNIMSEPRLEGVFHVSDIWEVGDCILGRVLARYWKHNRERWSLGTSGRWSMEVILTQPVTTRDFMNYVSKLPNFKTNYKLNRISIMLKQTQLSKQYIIQNSLYSKTVIFFYISMPSEV